jgi:hypothetical protein
MHVQVNTDNHIESSDRLIRQVEALKGSAKKLERILNDTAGRLGDPKGRTSYTGERTN